MTKQNYKLLLSLIFTCLVFLNNSFSQKADSFWYFGNGAGLYFGSGNPVSLNDGSLYTEEGCATISDQQGNLMFYTDGIRVWDITHRQMPNGHGLNGGSSSTQSALIVPMPGNNTLFYIFTACEKGGNAGLSYSVVDMMLNGGRSPDKFKNNQHLLTPDLKINYGKGDVTVKNKLLLAEIAEKLTAVRHDNGTDYWVITHQWNSDAFYAFQVSANGIGKPVISRIGTVHKDRGSGNNGESIGYLKPSPDGKRLALAVCYQPNNDVELFDFDNSTGKVSNVVTILTPGYAYGLSFSPDNSKLYVTFLRGTAGIMQYDLNARDITDSGALIAKNDQVNTFGAIQAASNGKIYVAKTGVYLDVINQPNAHAASCDYRSDVVNLGAKSCVYGLPNFLSVPSLEKTAIKPVISEAPAIQVGAKATAILGNDTILRCVSEYIISSSREGSEYTWSTGETAKQITVKRSGVYTVTVTDGGKPVEDEIQVTFEVRPTVFKCLAEFEPTNPMFNNQFDFSLNDVEEFEMQVYDSKKKLVFETTDIRTKWKGKNLKGKDAPKGVYSWSVKYKPKCRGGEVIKENGVVSLKR